MFALAVSPLAEARSQQPPQANANQSKQAAQNHDDTAPSPPVTAVDQAAQCDDNNSGCVESGRVSNLEGLLVLFTAIIAVAGLVQAGAATVTAIGLKYAQRTADAAEKNVVTIQNTAKAQLRPYVYVVSAHVTDVKSPGPVRIHILVKNGGATPAYDMTNQSGSRFRPAGFNEFTLPAETPLSRGTLGPGMTVESVLQVERAAWNERIGHLMDGSIVLTVVGEILYRDAFGDKHRTRYRYHLPTDGGVRDGTLNVSEDGNEAD